jgi:hypothetical protein
VKADCEFFIEHGSKADGQPPDLERRKLERRKRKLCPA